MQWMQSFLKNVKINWNTSDIIGCNQDDQRANIITKNGNYQNKIVEIKQYKQIPNKQGMRNLNSGKDWSTI